MGMSSNKFQSPMERNNAFMVKVEDLVREIIIQNDIPYYRIESRMEHNTEDNTYLPVVRIITYFEDSVAPIAAVLRSEFDVEVGAPKDKQIIKVDSFSSKHIEYKVTLKSNRLDLIEYKRYGTKRFEIQACSMIQDAWNGIEKELGYNGTTIPDEARRDFYRVGAILEMADIEFLKIRGLLHQAPPEFAPAPAQEAKEATQYIPQSEPVVAAPQPQYAAPQQPQYTTPVQEAEKPAANVIAFQPAAYKPEPVIPAPVMQPAAQQTNTAMNGVAPQKVAASMNNNLNGYYNQQPITANTNNVEKANGVVKEILTEFVMNMTPAAEQPSPYAQQPPVYMPPVQPVAERQAEPVKLHMDNAASTLNVSANGLVEKAPEPVREQPAPQYQEPEPQQYQPQTPQYQQQAPQYNEERPRPAPQTIDENAQMTDASLKEYVRNSKILREIDSQIAQRASAKLNDEIDIEGDVERLRFLKVFSLKQLHERLADSKTDIIAFAEKWIGKDNGGSFDMGISLFYLEYLLVGKKNDPGFAVEYVLKFISDSDYSARYIIPTYNSIRQQDSSISKFSHLTLK